MRIRNMCRTLLLKAVNQKHIKAQFEKVLLLCNDIIYLKNMIDSILFKTYLKAP